MSLILKIAFAFTIVLYPLSAYSYIGPGLGAGAIATIVGVIGSIFLGLFAILYYPIKRMLKKRKKQKHKDSENPENQ